MAVPDEKVRIFVCYSHSDNVWVANNGLIPWLQKNLERNHVEFWWDREERDGIRGGDAWREKILAAIDRADIAILLISDDFASSPFIRNFEVPRIRERYNRGSLSIIPVLASPVSELAREDLAWVYGLQIVPSEELSLIECRGSEAQWHKTRVKLQDEIYRRVKLHQARIAVPPVPPKPAVAAAKPPAPEVTPAPKPTVVSLKPPSGGNETGRPVASDRESGEQWALIEEEIRNQLGDQSGTRTTTEQRARVTKLKFDNKPLTDAGASILADPAIGLNRLAELSLHGTKLTDKGLKELSRPGGGLVSLRDLWISSTNLTDEGINSLTRPGTGLAALRLLNLMSTRVTDAGLVELARPATGLRSLSRLFLTSTRVTDAGVKALARPDTGLNELTMLDLSLTSVTDASVRDLARADTGLKKLLDLNLGFTKVTDAGVMALARPDGGLKGLTSLSLSGTQVTDSGLKELARADTSCKMLEFLYLSYNSRITDAGLKELASGNWGLRALKCLSLNKTQVTDAGVAALRRTKPGINV